MESGSPQTGNSPMVTMTPEVDHTEDQPMMGEPNSTSELLTAQEVAAILRVQPSTVFAAAATGRLPVLRIWSGRRKSLLRFRRADIEVLIRSGHPMPDPKG
jgi:helix-turn-helix protein